MANLGDLNIAVKLVSSGFNSGVSKIKSGLASIGSSVISLNQGLDLLSKGFSGIKALFSAGRDALNAGMTMQRLENAFKAITGSSQAATKEIQWLRDETKRLGQDFLTSADAYKGLAAAAMGTALEGDKVRQIFSAVSGAATVLGLSTEQVNGALMALSQMISKGVVSSEELKLQLGERLPGAVQLAAKAMGMNMAQFTDALEKGKIKAVDFLPKLAKLLEEQFGAGLESASKSAQANMNRMGNAWEQLKQKFAEGGFTNAAAQIFERMAAVFENPAFLSGVRGVGQAIADMAGFIMKNAVPAINTMLSGLASFVRFWNSTIGLDGIPSAMKAMTGNIGGAIKSLWNRENYKIDVDPNKIETALENAIRDGYESQTQDFIKRDNTGSIDPIPEISGKGIGANAPKLDDLKKLLANAKAAQAPLKEIAALEKQIAEIEAESAGKPPKDPKSGSGESTVRTLQKAIEETKAMIASVDMNDLEGQLAKVDADIEGMRIQYSKQLKGKQGPEIDALIEQLRTLRKEAIQAQKVMDAKQLLKDVSFEAATLGLSDFEKEWASIQRQFEGAQTEGTELGKILDDLKGKLESKYVMELEIEVKEKNQEIAKNRMTSQAGGLADILDRWTKRGKGIRRGTKEGTALTAGADNEITAMLQELSNTKMPFDEWIVSASKFTDNLESMRPKIEELGMSFDDFKAHAEKAFDISAISGGLDELVGLMEGPFAEALTSFAETGDAGFAKLAQSLMKSLQAYAAQMTSHLLMIALKEGIMALVEPTDPNHAIAAGKAATGAAIMGSFVLGSGLANMAHDGMGYIPEDGTWLLQKGERVVNDDDNKGLSKMVGEWSEGKGKGIGKMTININNSDESGVKKALPDLKKAIIEAVNADISSNGSIRRTILNYT